jgi:predicted esterase
VVLGLHGYGSWPEDFTGADHQKICDDLDVAFFSLSGTIPLGRNSFMWSARHEDDWSRIQKALKRVEGQVVVKPGQIMAVGFSMGGQLAVHLTAAYPQEMAGCLAMSPGSRYPGRLAEVLQTGAAKREGQSVFLSWISAEGAGIKARSQEQAAVLEKHGVSSYVHEFPGKGHHFPRAYADYYGVALQVIRKGAEKR